MDLVGKDMSLLFNMLSRMVMTFLPRSKHILISWLQSPSAVILETKKTKSVTLSIVSPSLCYEVMGLENNRMGKTRDLFKKVRDTKGTFHAKMGLIKDRNGTDLQKQKILRRGGKNTQKNCTKKIFTTQIIMMV